MVRTAARLQAFTQEELQLVMDRRHLQNRLRIFLVKLRDDISGVTTKKHAIASVCEAFSDHRRQALLVMATGLGKLVQQFLS